MRVVFFIFIIALFSCNGTTSQENFNSNSYCIFKYDSLFGGKVLTNSDSLIFLENKFKMDFFLKSLTDTSTVGQFAKKNRESGVIGFIVKEDGSLCCCRKPGDGLLNFIDKWVYDRIKEKKWKVAKCEDVPYPYYMNYNYHL